MIVVASMKYPPQSTHIRWGLSSVILILVVRCMVTADEDSLSRELLFGVAARAGGSGDNAVSGGALSG